MATRRERVVLDVQSNAARVFARDAAAAGLLAAALDELDGSGNRLSDSTRRLGNEARRNDPLLNTHASRLRLLTEAAVTLGPALVPLGASVIPALTGALAGLGAAAGAVGVTVLAFQGLGKGLKALDAYQLEPTAQNLANLRIEMEKLGPAGAHFVHFLDQLEPQFSDLQKLSRAGLFPGVEDSINVMLEKLPQVKEFVYGLALRMGDLAREAGSALAGDKFSAFFDYIKTDARPTLEAFAHATGNVVQGIANMFVAFAPATRSFTDGLVHATAAFAKWSAGLGENQGFQDFLQYIREAGPQAAAFLGALTDAVVGIVRAAAPLGHVVLNSLTALAKVFAVLADSPIGPPLYTAAAALIAFNRAAIISTKAATALNVAMAATGAEASTLGSKLTFIGSAGAAAALGIGTVNDGLTQLDSRNRSNDTLDATVSSLQDLQDTVQFSNLGKYANDLHIDLGRLTDDLAKNGAQGEYVKQVQEQLAGSSHGVGAAFNALAGNIIPFYTSSADKAYGANKDLLTIIDDVGNGVSTSKGAFAGLIDSLEKGTSAALDLSGALAVLNGWFDKRDAVRAYKDSIDTLTKGLKDGFTREDAANVDAIGRSILQVAQQIKNPVKQANFLAGARAQLVDLAQHSGPKAAAAIQEIIDKFDNKNLTHPPKPKLDVDTKEADDKVFSSMVQLHKFGNTVAIAHANVDDGQATSAINAVTTMLRNLNGTTATTYVRTVRNDIPLPGRSADGGTIPGQRRPYGDKMLYLLAPGEEVISNRYGQADRHRDLLKAINAGRLADGGTSGGNGRGKRPQDPYTAVFVDGIYSATKALKAWKKALDDQKAAIDKARQNRDDAIQRRDDLAGTIRDNLTGDSIFAGSTNVYGANQYGANTPQGAIAALNARKQRAQQFVAAVNALKKKGVTGAALQAILSEGLDATVAMAAADVGTLRSFSAAVGASNHALAAAGLAGGNAVFGGDVKATQQALDSAVKELAQIKHAIKHLEAANKKSSDDNAKKVTAGVNGAASNGHRRGKH